MAVPSVPGTTRASKSALAFTGKRPEVFGLALKIAFLTILTLGIYRFWGKTHLRRYFWRHTRLLGDPLEYTGTPGELFIGFLVAIAILAPLSFISDTLFQAALHHGTGAVFAAQATSALLLFCLIQFAFYRLWRYRLSRTLWRGIRFGLDGRALVYTGKALGWIAITLLTLGLAYPWMSAALWRYRLDNTYFGTTRMTSQAQGSTLIGRWLLPWSCFMIVGGFAGVVGYAINAEQSALSIDRNWLNAVLPLIPLGAILFVWYAIRQFIVFVSATSVGSVRLKSRLSVRRLLVRVLAFLIVAAILPAAVYAVVGGAMTSVAANGLGAAALLGFLTFGYVFAAVPVLWMTIVVFGTVADFVETLGVSNAAALEEIAQSTLPAPKRGEGFADALDVGAV